MQEKWHDMIEEGTNHTNGEEVEEGEGKGGVGPSLKNSYIRPAQCSLVKFFTRGPSGMGHRQMGCGSYHIGRGLSTAVGYVGRGSLQVKHFLL